ncbi:MAG TPA: DHH family phosphoesterase [Candidatus Omnitrophota bacterium]|nr:DHH family phosphoesterase [Candidatus Omnitrophota bacterium]HPS37404.1 DHH family phosphoesterase [Candidatus Omnitrophota bacterium]
MNSSAAESSKIKIPNIAARNGRKLLRFLEKKKDSISPLLIVTHDYPDPDAIATAMALQYIAERAYGIKSRIVYKGIIGRVENRAMVNFLRIPIHKIRPSDIRKYDHAALIDTQPEFENNPYPRNRKVTMVIDQHPYVKKPFAELAIIDTECGATSVILTQALLLSGLEIPRRIATALAYGILSDTLNLYRAHRADIIQTYLDILPLCDMRALIRIQNPPKSKKFFSTLNRGLQGARAFRGVIVSHLGEVEHPDLVSEIADFLLTYKGMERSLCTGRYKDKLHVSLRSNRPTDETPEILRDIFDDRKEAGGHDMVAGGSFHVTGKDNGDSRWQEAENTLVTRLLKRFRLPMKADFYAPFLQGKPRPSFL